MNWRSKRVQSYLRSADQMREGGVVSQPHITFSATTLPHACSFPPGLKVQNMQGLYLLA